MPGNGARPLGRPKESDSAETRQRLLAVARTAFVQRGYEATTNKELATAAGITPGAIYHYFPSKTDLYVAVFDEVLRRTFDAFAAAIDGRTTLAAQFSAVLDCTVELNRQEPTLTGFVVGVYADARRHPELATRLRRFAEVSDRFYGGLAAGAVARGEIPAEMARPVQDMIVAIISGLSRFSRQTGDAARHAAAVDALKRFLTGTMTAS